MVLLVCERGLAVRSRAGGRQVAGRGFWASPIAVEAGRLRAALGRAAGAQVYLEYSEGRLRLGARSMAAREI